MTATGTDIKTARLLVVMGVSGAGKSTVAEALAERLGYSFIDADHLHPKSNVEKMRGGQALEDADRWPWLEIVAQSMVDAAENNGRAVCACSALKRSYRDFLMEKSNETVCFILLHGDKAVIAERQANRPGHFMPPGLLDSQFATLEPFEADECALTMDVDMSVDEIVEGIVARIV